MNAPVTIWAFSSDAAYQRACAKHASAKEAIGDISVVGHLDDAFVEDDPRVQRLTIDPESPDRVQHPDRRARDLSPARTCGPRRACDRGHRLQGGARVRWLSRAVLRRARPRPQHHHAALASAARWHAAFTAPDAAEDIPRDRLGGEPALPSSSPMSMQRPAVRGRPGARAGGARQPGRPAHVQAFDLGQTCKQIAVRLVGRSDRAATATARRRRACAGSRPDRACARAGPASTTAHPRRTADAAAG